MKNLLLVTLFVVAVLAENFDVRSKWKCNYEILSQGCGDCWNFASVEAFSDRLCASGEAVKTMSPEPVLECNGKSGCNGGLPSTSWGYMIDSGTTTCDNACSSGCAPYDVKGNTVPRCHAGTCDSGSKYPETYKGGSFKRLNGISTYMNELKTNGPIQMCFMVYDNFQPFFDNHPTGIYTQYSGSAQGGHTVKLVGYGTSGSTDYWTLANSWGPDFGDHGYFKMLRGTNLCGIEGQVSAGYTKKQAARLGLPPGVAPSALNDTYVAGGWMEQTNLDQDLFFHIAKFGLKEISEKEGQALKLKAIVGAETQVVMGTNYRLRVKTKGERTYEVTVYRDLEYDLFLNDYQFLAI